MIKVQPDKLFPAQEKEEKVFLLIRKHWFNYVVFALIGLFMIVPAFVFIVFYFLQSQLFSDPIIRTISVAAVGAYTLFVLGLQLYGFISFYLDVYIVTDQRIVDVEQSRFFHRKISELNLRQVQDVNASVNGVIATFLHFGDVYVQTAGEHENFIFRAIPEPYLVARRIINLHEHHLENFETSPPIKKKYEKIEKEAKGLLKKKTFVDKVKAPGPFESDESKAFHSANHFEKKSLREGELMEGREISL